MQPVRQGCQYYQRQHLGHLDCRHILVKLSNFSNTNFSISDINIAGCLTSSSEPPDSQAGSSIFVNFFDGVDAPHADLRWPIPFTWMPLIGSRIGYAFPPLKAAATRIRHVMMVVGILPACCDRYHAPHRVAACAITCACDDVHAPTLIMYAIPTGLHMVHTL